MLRPNCGAENDADARFCTTCGAPLAPQEGASVAAAEVDASTAPAADAGLDANEAAAPGVIGAPPHDAEDHGPRLEPIGPKEPEPEPKPAPQPVLEPIAEAAEPKEPRLVPMGAEAAQAEPAPKAGAEPPVQGGGVTLKPLDPTVPSGDPAPKLEPVPTAADQNQRHMTPAPADPAATGRIPVQSSGPTYVDPSSEPALPAVLARCAALTVYAFLALSLIYSVALKGSAAADALAACTSSAAAIGSFALLTVGIVLALLLAFVMRGLDPKAAMTPEDSASRPLAPTFAASLVLLAVCVVLMAGNAALAGTPETAADAGAALRAVCALYGGWAFGNLALIIAATALSTASFALGLHPAPAASASMRRAGSRRAAAGIVALALAASALTLTGCNGNAADNGNTAASTENAASTARDVVLSLDVSGSMDGTPLRQMQDAATSFVEVALGADARVGLVSYDDNARTLASITDDEAQLDNGIEALSASASTNIEDGLREAETLLSGSDNQQVIVLMSDGAPNVGLEGDALVAYADDLKDQGIRIYTVGLNEGAEGHALLTDIANEGCHYEVTDAEDLEGFFTDIAGEVGGERYLYVRAASAHGGVNVSVAHEGETLSSADGETRTSFGTLAFEDLLADDGSVEAEDAVLVLRLKEGPAYDVQFEGTDEDTMDVTVGLADEAGSYEDLRSFESVPVSKGSVISLDAEASDRTELTVEDPGETADDADGASAGRTYDAGENETVDVASAAPAAEAVAEQSRTTVTVCLVVGSGVLLALALVVRHAVLFSRHLSGGIGAACAVATATALVAGALAVWQTGTLTFLLPPTRVVATYGSPVPLTTLATTRILPEDADGKALDRYAAYLDRAVNADGEEIAVSDARHIEVEGTSGFAVEDLLGTFQEGITYYVCIEDDDTVRNLPPITPAASDDTASADELPEVLAFAPASEEKDVDTARATAFLGKVDELMARYGAPEVATGRVGSNEVACVSGLSLATTIDFGDGQDRLAVAYYDGDDMMGALTSHDTSAYDKMVVEIWEYDDATGALRLAWQGGPNVGNGPIAALGMYLYPWSDNGSDAICMVTDVPDGSGDPEVWRQWTYWGVTEDSSFGELDADTVIRSWADERPPSDDMIGYGFSGNEESMQKTAQTVENTRAALEETVSNALASAQEEARKQASGAVAEVTGHEVTETVAVPTFTAGKRDGTWDYLWGYLELEGGDPAVTDKLNQQFKKAYDDELEATMNWEFPEDGEDFNTYDCLSFRQALTYCKDGLAGMRTHRYETAWGVHGGSFMESVVYDLATGDEVPVWEVAGLTSRSELEDLAGEAIVTYLRENPDKASLATMIDVNGSEVYEAARKIVDQASDDGNGLFMLTEEGITFWTPDYAMGSYADGNREIVVWAFDDESLVGTDVSAKYRLGLEP